MLTSDDLMRNGWLPGPVFKTLLQTARELSKQGAEDADILARLAAVRELPEAFLDDAHLGDLARAMEEYAAKREAGIIELVAPCPTEIWGREGIDDEALQQIQTASRLPAARRAALMPDGHVGYGLPIGGVLGLQNAVSPYAVGVDIACRMRLSVFECSNKDFLKMEGFRRTPSVEKLNTSLRHHLIAETRFGAGAHFDQRNRHDVLDHPSWETINMLKGIKDLAWSQLGSSGGGNHFVEFGALSLPNGLPESGIPPGNYLALMSHSGSRALGKKICDRYSELAMVKCRLPKDARHLAYLSMSSEDGQEYWQAMNLAGEYAAANHAIIHDRITRATGLTLLGHVENHHNFAWIENVNGEELVVHRKGATPAQKGVLGVIPGSLADAGFIVRGKGNEASLNSAAHGAGRRLGRREAKRTLSRDEVSQYVRARGVEVISAGIDESPQVYKNIHEVIAAMRDLVEVVGQFQPRLVRMADDGYVED